VLTCLNTPGSKPEEFPAPNRKPDHNLRHEIPRTAHLLYRLNGDYNPLHADDEAGKTAGFDGVIMHGKLKLSARYSQLEILLIISRPIHLEYSVPPGLVCGCWREGKRVEGVPGAICSTCETR